MSLTKVKAADAVAVPSPHAAIIDARSEAEFALDHLPGAVNWPTLNNDERRIVGTEYVQGSPFEARKIGACMAARNIAAHIEREGAALTRSWQPLVYCWRGGQRSGALALVLSQIGFAVQVLEGGYREFRRLVIAQLDALPPTLTLRVICGKTGSGKSRLLHALAAEGAQVLDLEALACHRGSVLGALPDAPQPSQKHFETRLWQALRQADARRPIFVESESRTVGRLRVPEGLLERMRAAPCIALTLAPAARVSLLMEDYAHLTADVPALCERLDALREIRGTQTVERWKAMAQRGQMGDLVQALLQEHYDPIYQRSMTRHFAAFEQAAPVHAADANPQTLRTLARQLIQAH